VLALAAFSATLEAKAEDKPVTGVPDESIAQDWTDPVRAAFAQRGVTYGVNGIGEYWNVAKGGNSTGSNFNGLLVTYTDVDLGSLVGWKGGAIHASAYYIHGIGPSTERIGNLCFKTSLRFVSARLPPTASSSSARMPRCLSTERSVGPVPPRQTWRQADQAIR
jgi:carbohydrate-selective porin OprB